MPDSQSNPHFLPIIDPHNGNQILEMGRRFKRSKNRISANEVIILSPLGFFGAMYLCLLGLRLAFRAFFSVSYFQTPLEYLDSSTNLTFMIGILTIIILYLITILLVYKKKRMGIITGIIGISLDFTLEVFGLITITNLNTTYSINELRRYFFLGLEAFDLLLFLILTVLSIIVSKEISKEYRRKKVTKNLCPKCKTRISNRNYQMCMNCGSPLDKLNEKLV